MTSPIEKIAVLGASSAGLLSAIALKQYFPNLQVKLLYTQKRAPIGVGESTTAWFPEFLHSHLKIPYSEFYQSVRPVWKLGIRFNWGHPNRSHFNFTFDRQIAYDVEALSHPPGYYCMHQMENASPLSILMDKGHAPMWRDQNGHVQGVVGSFGYHLGIDEFLQFLTDKAVSMGVEIQRLEVLGAERDQDGNILHLLCEGGVRVDGDLFFDCSGFQSKLLSEVMGESFMSFSDRLFCDSAVISTEPHQNPVLPYTTVTTLDSGWRWRIDLKNRASYGYVYSSQFCDQDKAACDFLETTPIAKDSINFIKFRPGRYRRFWVNNVIAIGNAAGFVEPLESTGQHMIAETIWRVVLALIDSHLRPNPVLVSTINSHIAELWEEISDFLALHFKFNYKRDTPFWKHCQTTTLLKHSQQLVELYRASGVCRAMTHLLPQSSIFGADGYLTILCGQKLPVNNLIPLTSSEQAEWNQYRKSLSQEVEHSFTVNQAFDFLDNYYQSEPSKP